MRGEHCVLGASILSAVALILLVFAHIGQISSGSMINSIYMAEVNVAAYGNALANVTKSTPGGLYDTSNGKLGQAKGLRQYYRYGLYNGCAYQKDGKGVCNSTTFAYPMVPLEQIGADQPQKYQKNWVEIIPASSFKDNGLNRALSRIGSALIFIGSALVVISLIVGFIKARLFFLIAAATSGLSALLLLVGAAMWTALIAKDSWIEGVKVQYGAKLGIYTSAGPSLYLTWVAFALVLLSVLPYVIACCTFRRN